MSDRIVRGRTRDTWYAAPTDKIVWSIEPRPDSTIVDLVMTLIIGNGGNKGRTMSTRVSIFTASAWNLEGLLYQISEAARTMVLYRGLNEKKFHQTINWSYHDYYFKRPQTSICASDARKIRGLS